MNNKQSNLELLVTRLTPPPIGQGFVPRPRLYALLEQSAENALVLVSAPAGSGKSSLLANWARENLDPVAWFSVEAEDNDPVRFWRNFTAALQTAIPATKFTKPFSAVQLGSGVVPGSLDPLCNTLG